MSIIYWMLDISPKQIEMLRESESLTGDLATIAYHGHYNKDTRDDTQSVQAKPPTRWDMELSQARARTLGLGLISKVLCLEKSWSKFDDLFKIYSDDPIIQDSLLFHGMPLGDYIGGYGPGWIKDVVQTEFLRNFIATLNPERLMQDIRYEDMAQDHLHGVPMGGEYSVQEFEASLRREIALFFPVLRDYVDHAFNKRHGLLCWLN